MLNERKRILVVEDEPINREMLTMVLEGDYDLTAAETGEEAMQALHDNQKGFSLMLLDLNLPDVNGIEILGRLKEEKILDVLPVIVLTADHEAEVESLNSGAMDFISKPYPRPEVIIARVRKTIELTEGRLLIGQTERDQLTGLYSREFFYRYAEMLDEGNKDVAMDTFVVDISHFHIINERYGKAYADEVLKRVARNIEEVLEKGGGIASRRNADTFLIYCPHRDDYSEMLGRISEGAAGEGMEEKIVRLRMGVYPTADKSIDIERRTDRAKMAADAARSTFAKGVAVYDDALHESTLFAEQLLVDFPRAMDEGQFVVYYQPKYDIRGEEPALSSAEALVRWIHPDFGMINPGVFIPLFEKNGLIRQLDYYVWKEAARQINDWKERLGVSVPVSVNVSRVDLFDPDILQTLIDLVAGENLEMSDLVLEVTESAYTEDSEHIIRTVEKFREAGFFIEMDDFGSGYSSLNMLSNLPIDALKLDMQFIRNAFRNDKNTRMLEIVIDISDSLEVPVIAEGVETAEQLFTLKSMGCDIVQGYYFSKPVPADRFETFLLETKGPSEHAFKEEKHRKRMIAHDTFTYEALHDPQTSLYNQTAFDLLLYDADKAHSALMLLDIEDYRGLEERLGRDRAQEEIVRVAHVLKGLFRSTDYVFRLREFEFAIILTRIVSAQRGHVFDKLVRTCEKFRQGGDGHPPVTIKVGIAFGDRINPQGDIFQDADTALNRALADKHNCCAIY